MTKQEPNKNKFDILGITASCFCILNCLALPVIIASTGFINLSDEISEFFHIAILLLIFLFSYKAFYPRWKLTREAFIPSIALTSIGLLIMAFILGDILGFKNIETPPPLGVLGSTFLILAHLLNFKSSYKVSV